MSRLRRFWPTHACIIPYGLRRSPQHWYQKIDNILCSIDLIPNPHDPCFYTGFFCNPRDLSVMVSSIPLSLELYVNDFVYFSKDLAIETLFERLLKEWIKVDFMSLAEWFLVIHFLWHFTKLKMVVHLNQSGHATNLSKQFSRDSWDPTPTATLYRSGIPIPFVSWWQFSRTTPSPGSLPKSYWQYRLACHRYTSRFGYSAFFPLFLQQ